VSFIGDHIDLILVAIVAVSLIPVAIELLRARSRSRDARYDTAEERADVLREIADDEPEA
jgi:membrane-associated protein